MDNHWHSAAAHRALTAGLPAEPVDATALVNWQRLVKSAPELDRTRRAARLTVKIHARILEPWNPACAIPTSWPRSPKMGWLLPPLTASQCARVVVFSATRAEDGGMKETMIGADLAKRVFQPHGPTMTGEVKFRKKLTRDQFRAFMAAQPAALVVFEACGSASQWAREMEALGHEVRLIAPQHVRPLPR